MQIIKLKTISFDKMAVSQNKLNITHKERSNLLPWKGQFSPQLIQSLLETYSKKSDKILDPFMGSGTVLHEASLMNLDAIGLELNPAAVKMAQIYLLSHITVAERKKHIKNIEKKIDPIILEDLPLFKNSHKDFNKTLSSYDLFYSIKKIMNKTIQQESRLILETYLILIDPKERQLTKKKARTIWQKLKLLIISLPCTKSKLRIIHGDCRKTPLKKNSIDLVITSPPYINVFNYHQQKRTSIEAMGWNILSVAKSEIGSNRKHRGNRYLTVIQYCLDMAMVLYELGRVCKPKAKLIFVIGRESQVKKTSFFNSEIIANIAKQVFSFNIDHRHERFFKNRYGQMIKEDILLLANPIESLKYNTAPNQIAYHVLTEASHRAPQEEKEALTLAIESINSVNHSPIYESKRTLEESLFYNTKGKNND